MTTGRPSSYKEEFAEQAKKLCKLGATDIDLADFFEVHLATINRWKHRYPEFRESLNEYKVFANANVERSLYQRATGYDCVETKVFNNQGEIVTHDVIKHFPPDPTSMIFWLKNRDPDNWRDKPNSEGGDDLAEVVCKLIDKLPS